MLDMLKSKTIIFFILLMLGVGYFNSVQIKMDEELNGDCNIAVNI